VLELIAVQQLKTPQQQLSNLSPVSGTPLAHTVTHTLVLVFVFATARTGYLLSVFHC